MLRPRVMSKFLSNQPYKGTRDFFPPQMRQFQAVMRQLATIVERFGFEPYDGPLLESFELYAAKTGQEIVENQLYWLEDRSKRKLAIRPEMTPTLARMVSQQVMELPKPIRWYSIPNLWRYERPQRGRLREHWQLNCDILGGDPQFADQEILRLSHALIQSFGGERHLEIRVNHREWIDEVFQNRMKLTAEQSIQVIKLVDAKAKLDEKKYIEALGAIGLQTKTIDALEAFLEGGLDSLQSESNAPGAAHLSKVIHALNDQGLSSNIIYDPTIMRGMDYYTGLVFEIYDRSPENRRAMFGGGRYDHLLGLFGKNRLSGIGFGMGDVTIQDFLQTHSLLPDSTRNLDVYFTLLEGTYFPKLMEWATFFRALGLSCITALEPGKLAHQLKVAAKHQARHVVILGSSEWDTQTVSIKALKTGTQSEVKWANLKRWAEEQAQSKQN